MEALRSHIDDSNLVQTPRWRVAYRMCTWNLLALLVDERDSKIEWIDVIELEGKSIKQTRKME